MVAARTITMTDVGKSTWAGAVQGEGSARQPSAQAEVYCPLSAVPGVTYREVLRFKPPRQLGAKVSKETAL